MKLQYRISIMMMVVSFAILSSISYFYSEWSYKSTISNEKKKLVISAIDSALHIELELLDNLSNVKTLASAPIVTNMLQKSNAEYETLSYEQTKEHISQLNTKWMLAKSADDSFIQPYMNNALAEYLKKQQSVLEGVYGELFITNRHGAMIATTGKLTTLAHAQKYWWKESYSGGDGKNFFDDRGFDKSVGGYVIGIVVPIKDNGEIIGILKANVNIISALSNVVERYAEMNHGSLEIVRTKGKVVYADAITPLSKNVESRICKNLENRETGSSLFETEIVSYAPIRLSIDNEEVIFGGKAKTLDQQEGNDGEIWHTVIHYSKETALKDSQDTNDMIILVGIIFTVLAAVFAYIIGLWISRPIEKLHKAQDSIRKQEEIMIAQSRQAAMGEMISMLAHQWRQPISAISMGVNNILADIELDTVDEKTLKEGADKILLKTKELSNIIDDFRGFFQEETSSNKVTPESIVSNSLDIIGKSLENNGIKVVKDIQSQKEILTYSKELTQVIINILKNSKEAILEAQVELKQINLSVYEQNNKLIFKICDSGGGIEDDILDKVFNPYFTTKGVKSGLGLGLYISKTIVEKRLEGSIKCYNHETGVCFELEIPFSVSEGKNDAK